MLPLSELNKSGSTPKNWSAMLDAFQKLLAWFRRIVDGRVAAVPGIDNRSFLRFLVLREI
jgi:hypothetical protein